MNNFIKARPAQKHSVATNREPNSSDTPKGLSKIEGIITSPIKLKEPKNDSSYYWAFFQLEGLDQEIPIIFRVKCPAGNLHRPIIPLRSKVLLTGQWAESPNSTRPSFTCTIYEILADPPPLTIKSLREQISQLLTTSLEKQSEWKQRTDYLFKRLETLKDLEKLTKLGDKYLSAYLLLKSASYANYQDNLLPDTAHLTHPEEYLAKLVQKLKKLLSIFGLMKAKEL